MHQTEAGEVPEDSSWYYYARRFAEGMGKAYIGFSEAMSVMVKVLANGGNPRYLFAARYSIYDALASDYPVYAELKKAATVPDAHVFRIKPDGEAYMNESKENKDLLPPLSE